MARDVLKEKLRPSETAKEDKTSPIDNCYTTLSTNLEIIDSESPDHARILQYFMDSQSPIHNFCLKMGHVKSPNHLIIWNVRTVSIFKERYFDYLQMFRVVRRDERERFLPFQNFNNRRLLWHGSRTSNIAGILMHVHFEYYL